MRTTQYMGLSLEAMDWLAENATKLQIKTETRIFNPRTRKYTKNQSTSSDFEKQDSKFKAQGIDMENVPLTAYVLTDETVVHEKVQAVPWSSGPMIFTALAWPTGTFIKETLWDEKDIEAAA